MIYKVPALPVTTNAGFKTGRGRFYETKEYREYKDLVALLVKPKKIITQDVELYVAFHVNRDRDIDGGLKCLCDALEGILYENDKQIVKLDVVKIRGFKRAEVSTLIQIRPAWDQQELIDYPQRVVE